MSLPDTASIATYGGAKQNYAPVEDPTTDQDAGDHNQLINDVAGLTHLGCRAARSFVSAATTGAITDPASGLVHDAAWGASLAVKPTVTRNATGVFDVQWPATVTDELGATKTLNLRRAWVSVEGTAALICSVSRTDERTFRIRLFTDAAAATDAVGTTVSIFVV